MKTVGLVELIVPEFDSGSSGRDQLLAVSYWHRQRVPRLGNTLSSFLEEINLWDGHQRENWRELFPMMTYDLSQSFGPEDVSYETGNPVEDIEADFLFIVRGSKELVGNKEQTVWKISEIGALGETEFSEGDIQWIEQNVS